METLELRFKRWAPSLAALALLLSASTASAGDASISVLLITLDTFRGDHLGVNGSPRVETPCLDEIAQSGVNFSRARAQVPLTLPSHASILTGLYPHSHGVRNNGVAALRAEETTLAETLESEGYATAAFLGSFVLDRRFGLDQGFEHYDDRVATDPAMLERVEAERDGTEVVRAFERWLAERTGTRSGSSGQRLFFAWLHLYDPHAPYEAPEPFRSKYPRDAYGAEIAYTDSLVCRALDAVDAKGDLDRTLVAVVGDHGEGLGEHRETTHSLLIYNSTLHVPMLIRAPGLLPAVTVPDLVRTIDLAPTLLDYLGHGESFGEGVSLKRLIESRRIAAGAPAELVSLGESLYGADALGWSPLFGMEAGSLRFIQAPEPELYDLARDPGETRNLAAESPELADELARRLESMLLSAGTPERAPPVALEAREIEKLRGLGYLAGGDSRPRSSGDPGTPPADPKSKIEVFERIQGGIGSYGRGDFAEAAHALEGVLRTERDVPLLFEYLSSSYVNLGAWEKFERLHDLAEARGVESASLHLDRGRRHSALGDLETARQAFERALELEPLSVTARWELGELAREDERFDEAVAFYRDALSINPGYAFAWNGLGVALSSAREGEAQSVRSARRSEALTAFERAVELAPDDPRAVLNLAVQLERMGRTQPALERYEQCLELARASGSVPAREAAAAGVARLRRRP